MADYNIYIHTIGGGSSDSGSKTTPVSFNSESPTKSWTSVAQKGISIASNPDSLVSSGIGAFAKAIPAIAIAYAAIKLTDKAITTVNSFVTTETGDYRFTVGYENFKTNIRTVLTPFSSSLSALKSVQNMRIEDMKRSQQRELLGDSVINSLTSYGV